MPIVCEVPTHLNVSDTIVFGLGAHQLVRLAAGSSVAYLVWDQATALDVTGADSPLGSADDATQEAILAGRAQFLNAQLEPFQVLIRTEPAWLDDHLNRIRERANELPPALAGLARDHVAFVGGLT